MSLGSRIKAPNDSRTYAIDWSAFLVSLANDTISSFVPTVPSGLTLVAQSNTTTKTNVKLSGGTTGTQYTVLNKITTAAGEIKEVSFQIVVKAP